MRAGTAMEDIYKSRNPFVRWYSWHRLKKAVRMAGLQGNETVLDFGCHAMSLKKVLPNNCNYIGYDSFPPFSDVKDYSKLKNVDIAFALAVFEHLTAEELRSVLANFKKMGIKKIVSELPREDCIVNRAVNSLMGFEFEHVVNHKIDWRTAARIIDEFYSCTRVYNNLFISWISVWEK